MTKNTLKKKPAVKKKAAGAPAKPVAKGAVKKAIKTAAHNIAKAVNSKLAKTPKVETGAVKSNESALWEWLRDGVEDALRAALNGIIGELKLLHWLRIESGTTGSGIPDVEGCFRGRAFWIELKSAQRPVKGQITTGLTSEQAMFLKARLAAGGLAWILIRVSGNNGPDSTYLIHARRATLLTKPIYETKLREFSEYFEDPREMLAIIADEPQGLTPPMADAPAPAEDTAFTPGQ